MGPVLRPTAGGNLQLIPPPPAFERTLHIQKMCVRGSFAVYLDDYAIAKPTYLSLPISQLRMYTILTNLYPIILLCYKFWDTITARV